MKRKKVDCDKLYTYSKRIQKANLKQLLKDIYLLTDMGNLFRTEKKYKQINPKLSNWSYNEHIRMLHSKLDLFDIHTKLIDDSYTRYNVSTTY